MPLDKERLQEIKIERYREKLETAFKSYSHNANRLEIIYGILFISSISIASSKDLSLYVIIGISTILASVSIFVYDLIKAYNDVFNLRRKGSENLDKILDDVHLANNFKLVPDSNKIPKMAGASLLRNALIGILLIAGLAFILFG